MNGGRPGEGAAWGAGEWEEPYAEPGTWEAAVSSLSDPLTDPLPGTGAQPPEEAFPGYDASGARAPDAPHEEYAAREPYAPTESYGTYPLADALPADGYPPGAYPDPAYPAEYPDEYQGEYRSDAYRSDAYQGEYPGEPAYGTAGPSGLADPAPPVSAAQETTGGPAAGPAADDPETVGLRRPGGLGEPADTETVGLHVPSGLGADTGGADTGGEKTAAEPAAPARRDGGRAARRKAARRGGRRRAGSGPRTPPPPDPQTVTGGRAARRKAAKAAAKAARQTGTAISNVIGELFITTGALMLLFVVYQVWWTNVEARAHANHEREQLQREWDENGSEEGSRTPGAFQPGEGFAVLYLPTLDVVVPIAETVDESSVLDKGMVGHYSEEDGLPTAMPWDEEGNVGLAGHRNTHGEPFRYINRLEPGDPIVIETADAFYTYEMTSRLDSTSPSNIAVLDPVPEQGGFTQPGRYVTLTTCTPEFTSTYRLIVWGEMVEERPRSEGMPDALVG